ncbi:MAG: hypothetical protein H2045_05770 [Rhizobiales bacterium]|nr:hypothetical protein [Hyphomicrobiales bacterium]
MLIIVDGLSLLLNRFLMMIHPIPRPFLWFAAALTAGCLLGGHALAAKTVPTIRIEVPKKDDAETPLPDAEPTLRTVPEVPLDLEQSAPSTSGEHPVDEPGEDEPSDYEAAPAEPDPSEAKPPVTVYYGDADLPEPVKATRQKLLDAAHSGDIERLRPIFDSFTEPPILSFDNESDPIAFLKASSGDGNGLELLAIMTEVLESGYIRRDEGADHDVYMWPYFVDIPPAELNAKQLVELFRIITAGDFEDMKAYGTYIFYRIGITPDGQLKFFVAGD